MFDTRLLCKAQCEMTGNWIVGFYYYLPKADGFIERHYIVPLGSTKFSAVKVVDGSVRYNTNKQDHNNNNIFEHDNVLILNKKDPKNINENIICEVISAAEYNNIWVKYDNNSFIVNTDNVIICSN